MKILVLGDIHGRTIWKDIIKKESPDKVIFLGDYVATHEGIPADQQLSNLNNILNYKEENSDKVVLLRGNHDIQHLGYYWARCSSLDPKVRNYMAEESFREYFLKLTQWIYVDENLKTIFSHAGVSAIWLRDVEEYIVRTRGSQYDDGTVDQEVLLGLINTIEPSELFEFNPDSFYDYYGDSVTQPPIWIRPQALYECNIADWDQVVGHTPVIKDIINIREFTKNNRNIWLCDALNISKYLIIDNNEFIPSEFKK